MVSSRVAEHSWRLDQPLYKNADTGLPCTLGPYWISKDDGAWLISDEDEKVILGRADDFFVAFRVLVDAYEKWWRKHCNPSVYFIGANTEKTTLVKIGYALNVKARLSAIQTGNPAQMRILATVPGGRELESQYHSRFKAQRRKGEWFVINGAIQAEISRLSRLSHPLTTEAR